MVLNLIPMVITSTLVNLKIVKERGKEQEGILSEEVTMAPGK